MFSCLNPIPIVVYPEGSYTKKDGSKGHKVRYNARVSMPEDFQPDIITGEVASLMPRVPCGKCINCRRNQALMWASRISLEKKKYSDTDCCFLTLTYDDRCIPINDNNLYTLDYSDVQGFLKRLRKRVGNGLRFFCAGEYGEDTFRPHYHVLLFGYNFFDSARFVGCSGNGFILFENDLIIESWKKGISNFGFVDDASILYVSQYNVKKLLGCAEDYEGRVQPFVQMSRKPGIGCDLISDNVVDILSGNFYMNGHKGYFGRYTSVVADRMKRFEELWKREQKCDFLEQNEREMNKILGRTDDKNEQKKAESYVNRRR